MLWECFLLPGAAGRRAGEVGLSPTTVRQPVQLSGSHGSGHGSTGCCRTGLPSHRTAALAGARCGELGCVHPEGLARGW